MRNRQGSILIFALWTLVVLTTFSIYLGFGVRQRMIMVQRLESRHKLYLAASSGVRKAIAMLHAAYEKNDQPLSVVSAKAFLMNNIRDFRSIDLGDVTVDIERKILDKTFDKNEKHYGMIDEASKININFADKRSLVRLFQAVFGWDAEGSEGLAIAIIDWRTPGTTTLKGFFSQEYYKNLRYPYEPKGRDFELVEELLLVEGMRKDIFERLRHFVTVYGDGRVNVNTATFPVLYAIGFTSDVAKDIIQKRIGFDDIEGTADDITFRSTEDFAAAMSVLSMFTENDALFVRELHGSQKITTTSDFYSIQAKGYAVGGKQQNTVRCVYDAAARTIVYWNES